MVIEKIGWSRLDEDVPQPPVSATIEAIGLLISHRSASPSALRSDPQRTLVWISKLGTMVGKVSPRVPGWRSGSSQGGPGPQREPTMCNERGVGDVGVREAILEKELERIAANPVLANEAFPDKTVRANIVPLFQYFRSTSTDPEDRQISE